jgi:hypothetical protein
MTGFVLLCVVMAESESIEATHEIDESSEEVT